MPYISYIVTIIPRPVCDIYITDMLLADPLFEVYCYVLINYKTNLYILRYKEEFDISLHEKVQSYSR